MGKINQGQRRALVAQCDEIMTGVVKLLKHDYDDGVERAKEQIIIDLAGAKLGEVARLIGQINKVGINVQTYPPRSYDSFSSGSRAERELNKRTAASKLLLETARKRKHEMATGIWVVSTIEEAIEILEEARSYMSTEA